MSECRSLCALQLETALRLFRSKTLLVLENRVFADQSFVKDGKNERHSIPRRRARVIGAAPAL